MSRLHATSLIICSLFLMMVLYVTSGTALAQVSGSMTGRVEDPSEAPIPSVEVTVTSLETGGSRTVTTDETGSYRVLSLPVGRYEIRAQKAGFKAEVQTGINLAVGQQAVVNLKLAVGAVQEQVTVTSDAPLVNTTTQSVAGLVGEQQIKELPINGRSFDLLISLNPGTINYTSTASRNGSPNANMFSVAGRRPSENVTLMNGIEFGGTSNVTFTPASISGQLLGIDAVREYNVVTDTYGAEYGKRAGGQVSVVTQSGTNQLHGTLFEFLRNSALDARNFYDPGGVPPFQRNQFGGALGGPIRKDKTFLFGNYEGFRQRLAGSGSIFVPDLNARKGFLPCGSGGPTCAAGAPVGTPTVAPGLDPRMLPFMSYWPEPNGPVLGGGVATYYGSPVNTITQDFYATRFDQTLSAKNSLSAVYIIDNGRSLSPAITGITVSNGGIRNQILSLQDTHIFSPRVVNVFTAGVSRTTPPRLPQTVLSAFPPGTVSFVKGEAEGTGSINFGSSGTQLSTGVSAAGGLSGAVGYFIRTIFTYSDSLQVVRGKHQISAGVWFQRIQANEFNPQRQNGLATFNNLQSLLQGQVSTFIIGSTTVAMNWRTWLGAWYLQDSIQLRPNLTLRVGLRHEFSNGWGDVGGKAQTYDFLNGVIQTVPKISDHFNTANNSKWLFGPRIGLAWNPFGNGKTSIRAAGGIYYDLVDALSYLVDVTPPLGGQAAFSDAKLLSLIPYDASNVPPPCGPNVPAPCNIYIPKSTESNYKVPTVQSWNFGVEQQVARDMVLRVAYVGSQSYHQFMTIDPNAIPSQRCANPAGCVSGGVGSARGAVPQGAEYIPVGARPNAYLSYGIFLRAQGNSSYNGLQVDLVKRLSRGLQFRSNYTWSKSLDVSSGIIGSVHGNQGQTVLNQNNLRQDWGPSGMDIRHQVGGNVSYELPVGRGKAWLGGTHGVAGKLVSGWQVNGIVTVLSGFAFTPQIGANRSGNGDQNTPDRPSWNPAFTGSPIIGTPDHWYDPKAFILPIAGTFGNVGNQSLRGPDLFTLNFSLHKNTRITERLGLQFRAELFNALNHTNLGTPNLSVFTGNTYSPSAGVISKTATTSRQIQFGLKLTF